MGRKCQQSHYLHLAKEGDLAKVHIFSPKGCRSLVQTTHGDGFEKRELDRWCEVLLVFHLCCRELSESW